VRTTETTDTRRPGRRKKHLWVFYAAGGSEPQRGEKSNQQPVPVEEKSGGDVIKIISHGVVIDEGFLPSPWAG